MNDFIENIQIHFLCRKVYRFIENYIFDFKNQDYLIKNFLKNLGFCTRSLKV